MSTVKSIAIEVSGTRDLALIDSGDSVWIVQPFRWWDFATLAWWLFTPSDRRARVKLTLSSGEQLSVRAVRVATRFIRLRGEPLQGER